MSIAPLFSTAPRIKIKLGNSNVAYAIGLSLNISVNIQPVTVLGKFGPVSLEPTIYNVVTGTLQIIRLTTRENAAVLDAAAKIQSGTDTPSKTIITTNADGSTTETTTETRFGADVEGSNNPLSQNSLIRHMDPRSVLLSSTFSMELQMRVPNASNDKVLDAIGGSDTVAPGDFDVNNPDNANSGLNTVPWLRVNECRITSRNVNISVGQLVNEPLSFQGIWASPVNIDGDNIFFKDSGAGVAAPA